MIYKNAEGRRATVPFHAAKVLHPKVLKSIMRDAGLSAEDLEKLPDYRSGRLTGLPRGYLFTPTSLQLSAFE